MKILDEGPGDVAAVRRIVEAIFGRSDEARLIDDLRAAGDLVLCLVGVESNRLVAHLALSKMQAPFPSLALAPVAVIRDRQRRGLGSTLIVEAIRRAREAGWAALFVLGDPHFYGRFGFEAKLAHGYASPYAGPHFMALALDGPFPTKAGVLQHAPAFAELG